MLATRYSIAVIGLLFIALIPTVIHNYLGLKADENFSVRNISEKLDEFTSKPSSRLPLWGEETFDCYDWIERIYTDENTSNFRLFACKSFDHKRLFHHPELALSYGKSMAKDEIQWLTVDDRKIPVNVLRDANGAGLAAYVLWNDGHFVENPIQYQVKNTLELLVSPKRPMTLFYISDNESRPELSFKKTKTAKLLLKAIQSIPVISSPQEKLLERRAFSLPPSTGEKPMEIDGNQSYSVK